VDGAAAELGWVKRRGLKEPARGREEEGLARREAGGETEGEKGEESEAGRGEGRGAKRGEGAAASGEGEREVRSRVAREGKSGWEESGSSHLIDGA